MSVVADAQAGASFFLDVDESGEILRCQGDTFTLLGLSPNGIEGISLYDLVTEGEIWIASDAVSAVGLSGEPQTDRVAFNNHNGDAIPFRITTTRVSEDGKPPILRLYAMTDDGSGDAPSQAAEQGVDIATILSDVEEDLRGEVYDDPTLSIYSLDAEGADPDDIDAILAAADRMTSSVALAAQGKATSFRVDRQTVSVLHGRDFDAEAVSATASEAAGPDYGVGRAAIDLAESELGVQEKLDLIEKTITATRLADVRLESGTVLSASEARTAIDRQVADGRAQQRYGLEIAYSTSSGAPVLSLLTFANPMSALGATASEEELKLAQSMLEGRIEAAQAVAKKQETPACVAMDATMLARLGQAEVLVLATGVGKLAPKDGERFAAVFSRARRAIVDGADLATSSALQRLISKTDNLEFIRVPRERFGEDPAAVAESFRKIAQLCARRDVALYVNGIEDTATALELRRVSQICLGGPAVFPGLFQD